MSRSRRAPIYTEGYGSPDKKRRKRQATRRVRAADDIANGAAYKRYSNPWDICDYKFKASKDDPKPGRK